MERLIANNGRFVTCFTEEPRNRNSGPLESTGIYHNAFNPPEPTSNSSTPSESSMTSSIFELPPTIHNQTAATGNLSSRQSSTLPGFTSWVDHNAAVDDMTVGELSFDSNGIYTRLNGRRWPTIGHDVHTFCSHLRIELPNSHTNLPEHMSGEESPAYLSLAPIQVESGSHSICPNCRCQHTLANFCPSPCHSDEVGRPGLNTNSTSLHPIAIGNRFYSHDHDRTPTKRLSRMNPPHSVFPPLIDTTRNIFSDSPGNLTTSFNGYRHGTYGLEGSANGNTIDHQNEDQSEYSSQPLSPLELTGDVRTVNLPALDQHPLRTCL